MGYGPESVGRGNTGGYGPHVRLDEYGARRDLLLQWRSRLRSDGRAHRLLHRVLPDRVVAPLAEGSMSPSRSETTAWSDAFTLSERLEARPAGRTPRISAATARRAQRRLERWQFQFPF